MNNTSLGNITIQQIEIFLSVAESRNFTTAANELSMTQPGVSKSIATLEQLLGYPLFLRTSRKVELTEEGVLLYEKWKYIGSDIRNGYIYAKSNYDKRNAILNIGVTDTTDPSKYFWPIVNQFQLQYPNVMLNIESDNMLSLQQKLGKKYDLIFIPDFEHYDLDQKNMPWKYAAKNNVQIIVLLQNSLSKKRVLHMEDIIDSEVTSLAPETNANFLRALKELYAPYGCEPKIAAFYHSNFQVQSAHFLKDCIHITDDYWTYTPNNISKKIPLKDHFNGIICSWDKKSTKPFLKTFLDFVPEID